MDLPPVYSVFLQVSIEWRVEIVDIVMVPLHPLLDIMCTTSIARSSMLIAAYVDETSRHIIIRTVCVADGDLEGLIRGMGVVHHVDF